jgi:hypothetical protein
LVDKKEITALCRLLHLSCVTKSAFSGWLCAREAELVMLFKTRRPDTLATGAVRATSAASSSELASDVERTISFGDLAFVRTKPEALFDLEFFDPISQRAKRHPQDFGSGRLVIASLFKRFDDGFSFDILQMIAQGAAVCRAGRGR